MWFVILFICFSIGYVCILFVRFLAKLFYPKVKKPIHMQPIINTPKEKPTTEFKITDVVLYVSDADKERRK